MRAIWSGAIGFGLVNIPVKLYSATQSSKLDLDMLDKHGYANIRYARVNSSTGKEVAWENIVKGYKYNGDYVVLTDDDIEKVSPKKNKVIDISEFVDEEKIGTAYFDTPYYLEPAKGGEKAYVLLREALKSRKKVAVGEFILRNRDNLCLIKPQENVLMLQKIRFAEEIRDYTELDIPKNITLKPEELKMAGTLINQLTKKKFTLQHYKDTYDNELMKIIVAKSKGKKITQPKFKLIHNKNKDLMTQLKASLTNGATNRKKAS